MNKTESSNGDKKNGIKPQILEQGDIYFFYRPKVDAKEVKSIDDVRRFYVVTSSEERIAKKKNPIYMLIVIGKKSLPEIRPSEARQSERYWARIGGVFSNSKDLVNELMSDEFRKGDAARPTGEGKYAIIKKNQNHVELAYILEMPKDLGIAQKELGIEKEASYIVTVINPKNPSPKGYPSTDQSPRYPDSIMKQFDNLGNFVSLAENLEFIDYPDAQIILIGAREGRDIIKKDLGIELEEIEEETTTSADVFNELKIRKEQVPIKSLTEGILE